MPWWPRWEARGRFCRPLKSLIIDLWHLFRVDEQAAQVKRYRGGNDGLGASRTTTGGSGSDARFPMLATSSRSPIHPPFASRCYVLSITNIYAHVWPKEVVQEILGSSCRVFESSPYSVDGSDLSSYLVVAWTRHPNLIPTEVGCVVPEPDEPSVVGHAEEIIHSKQDALQCCAFIEVHDFSPREEDSNSDDDDDFRFDPN
jgi:hypothetical protein